MAEHLSNMEGLHAHVHGSFWAHSTGAGWAAIGNRVTLGTL